ncbi:hypothetical protein D3C80_1944150 [compost metagenome]
MRLIKGFERLSWQRFGEQPALTEMHPLPAQVIQLGLGFDAFRDHFQLQALGHFNDVTGH